MQRKQTDPAGSMNSIGVGMITLFRNGIGNIMNHDDPVKQDQENEDQHTQRKIV